MWKEEEGLRSRSFAKPALGQWRCGGVRRGPGMQASNVSQ